jgi:ssRNA-specific RNase YbeY (16S rRNA maturation enzyme)
MICPEHATDLAEAAVHGVLHLCGYDHETDDGAMLALQERIMTGLDRGEGDASSASPGRRGLGDSL